MKTAILLMGHGSRVAEANDALREIAAGNVYFDGDLGDVLRSFRAISWSNRWGAGSRSLSRHTRSCDSYRPVWSSARFRSVRSASGNSSSSRCSVPKPN